MSFEKGEVVHYFRAKHPPMKMRAVFVDQNKARARITLSDRGGSRTISVLLTQLEKVK